MVGGRRYFCWPCPYRVKIRTWVCPAHPRGTRRLRWGFHRAVSPLLASYSGEYMRIGGVASAEIAARSLPEPARDPLPPLKDYAAREQAKARGRRRRRSRRLPARRGGLGRENFRDRRFSGFRLKAVGAPHHRVISTCPSLLHADCEQPSGLMLQRLRIAQ